MTKCVKNNLTKIKSIDWLILLFYFFGLIFIFIPLDFLINLGIKIHPLGKLQDKTILLFRYIKVFLPAISTIGVIWMNGSNQTHKYLAKVIKKIVDSNWILPLILMVSLILRLGWIAIFPNRLYADSEWYFLRAVEIADGNGYLYEGISGKPTAAWPIGYPAFLSILFFISISDPLIGKIANVLLSVCIIFLTYSLTKKIFTHRIGIFSSFLLAIMPGLIVYSSLLNSDLLFMALFLLVLRLTLVESHTPWNNRSSQLSFLTGLILGISTLTRPIGLFLIPLLVCIKYITSPDNLKHLIRWSLYLAIGTFIIIIPWTIRNYIHFNKIIIVSNNGGVNFWMGNNPHAYGGFYFPRDDTNPLIPLIGDEVAVNEQSFKLGFKFIKENPEIVIRLIPAKIFYLYNSNDAGLTWNRSSAITTSQPGTGIYALMLTN